MYKYGPKEIIAKLKENGAYNPKYDYSKAFAKGTNEKITIFDENGFEYSVGISNYFKNGNLSTISLIDKRPYYLMKFKKAHSDKFKYPGFLENEYKGRNEKIEIQCDEHGIFEQRILKHSQGVGCPKCARKRIKWPTLKEMKQICKLNDINTVNDYNKKRKLLGLPFYPYRIYSEWISWPNLFGKKERYNREWANEDEIREFIVENDYIMSEYNLNRKYDMPSGTEFLRRYGKTFREIKYDRRYGNMSSINDFIGFCRENNINSANKFLNFYRLNKELCIKEGMPTTPNKVYPNFTFSMIGGRTSPKAKGNFISKIEQDILKLDPSLAFYVVRAMGIKIEGLEQLTISNPFNGLRKEQLDLIKSKFIKLEESKPLKIIKNGDFNEEEILDFNDDNIHTIFEQSESCEKVVNEAMLQFGNKKEAKELILFLKRYVEERLWYSFINGESTIEQITDLAPKGYKRLAGKMQKDYREIMAIPLTGYIQQKYQPNLMQRRTALKLKQNKSFGNWSGVGSGKTLAALFAGRANNFKNTIIITNNSTVEGWESSIKEHYGENNIYIKDFKTRPSEGFNYYIVNYEKFQLKGNNEIIDFYNEVKIDYVVLDEVHFAKQRELSDESIRRSVLNSFLVNLRNNNPDMRTLSMTATPIINNYIEGVKLLELITGRKYDDLSTDPESIFDGLQIRKHLLLNGTISRQKAVFVNGKKQKINRPTLNKVTLDRYDSEELFQKHNMVEELSYFKAILPFKMDIVENHIKKGTIIYTPYVTDILEYVADKVNSLGFTHGFYTGENKDGLEDFKNNNVDVLIASSSISVGIDGLQFRSNTLIKLLVPWTSSENMQLEGRIHREGSIFEEVNILEPEVELTLPDGTIYSRDDYRFKATRFKKTLSNIAMHGLIPEDLKISKTYRELKAKANKEIKKARTLYNKNKTIDSREEIEVRDMIYNIVELSTEYRNENYKPSIYRFTNKTNDKMYIGMTTQKATTRAGQHFYNPTDVKFHHAIKTTPKTDWQWEILEEVEWEEVDTLRQKESYYIDKFDTVKNGYNSIN